MLNKDNFIKVIANNLIYYRKKAGLTQLELAIKLNYSDKTISKWERKESLPDLHTLYELCSLYDITLNDLVYKKKNIAKATTKISKRLIVILSICLVWLFATIVFVSHLILFKDIPYKWLSFIYAIPISFVLFLIFSLLWEPRIFSFYAVTGLITTTVVSLALSFDLLLKVANAWFLVLLIIPLEFLAVFWFLLRKNKKELL